MPRTFEAKASGLLTLASLCNYKVVGRDALPLVDILCAVGLVLAMDELRHTGGQRSVYCGLVCLLARWVDSVGALATQTELAPALRCGIIVGQAFVVSSAAQVLFW